MILRRRKHETTETRSRILNKNTVKIFSGWLISEHYLKDQQKTETKQNSATVIILKRETEVKQQYASGLKFDEVVYENVEIGKQNALFVFSYIKLRSIDPEL